MYVKRKRKCKYDEKTEPDRSFDLHRGARHASRYVQT